MLGDDVYYRLDTNGRNYGEYRRATITRDHGDDLADITVFGNFTDYAHPFSIGIARFNKVGHGPEAGQWITRKEYIAEQTRLNREEAERREALSK